MTMFPAPTPFARRARPLVAGAFAIAALALVWPGNLAAFQSATNWLSRVTLGDGGSHILGNPAARVRLTEYVSYTCPHCRNYTEESGPAMNSRFVAPGRVTVEVRHVLRDPIDFAIAVAANCGSSTRFFSRHESLMQRQPVFLARGQAMTEAQIARWREGTPPQRLRRVATDVGVIDWMGERGFTAAQINACYADTAMHQRLLAMSNASSTAGVVGTPMFAINGRMQPLETVNNWATVSAALAGAVGN